MKKLNRINLDRERNSSGVYKIYDLNRRLVYVGRSNNGKVKHHLVQHFGSDKYSGAKFGDRRGYYYDIQRTRTPRKAEKAVIKRVKPKGNKYLYLKGKSRRR